MGIFSWLREVLPPEPHGDHAGDALTLHPPLTINQGWLEGEGVEHIPTRRTQALVHAHVDGVVWHWTATIGAGAALARRIRQLPAAGERSASWALLIPASGAMVQSAPTTRGTWHAAGPTAHVFDPVTKKMTNHVGSEHVKGLVSANAMFFGIEIENAGEVRLVTQEWSTKLGRWVKVDKPRWRAWPFGGREPTIRDPDGAGPGPLVPPGQVAPFDGRNYHTFTEHQVTQAERVVECLHREYRLPREAFLYNHAEINPGRKTDPGPLWMQIHLPKILGRVFS